MPLVVVPLAPEETDLLTIGEWRRLTSCSGVFFERVDHPLSKLLASEGVRTRSYEGEPDAGRDGWGLVADPSSPRLLELARGGAELLVGPAGSPDAISAAHGAEIARRSARSLATLAVVMARLRSLDGCPWDREQTHDSLTVHLLEEAHEVIDAIHRGAIGRELEEELGDVLLQVAFHARVAAQDGRFDLADVADRIVAKLLHRHPHVFGDAVVSGAAEVVRNWESNKAEEKSDVRDDIPRSLPALLAASKVQKRAAAAGFAPNGADARARLARAVESLDTPSDIGRVLFWTVAVARAGGIDPESALLKVLREFRASP